MRLIALLAPLALCTALTMPAFAQEFSEPGLISIDGRGEVVVAPDTAFVTSGVTTQGATAKEALDANTTAMNELIQTLKDAGIEQRDIQTSGFSVNPNYVYSDARDANGYQLPPKINGYQVFNTVNVRVRQLDTLGAVLDKAVTVGANTINGVSFSVADTSEILNEARKQALEDAREKAELYATAAGVELGQLRAITETQNMGGPIPYAAADMAFARAESKPVPVEGGELTYTINVSVSWALDQAD